jgi:hypothetical protein
MGGQQDRPGRRGRTHLALRLAGGGLLIAAGAIHLGLYLTPTTGIRCTPTSATVLQGKPTATSST